MLVGVRRRYSLAATAAAVLCVAACGPYEPIIDHRRSGYSDFAYQRDLAECRAYADQIDTGRQAIGGGLGGAAVGAAFGAIIGSFDGRAGRGAGFGASVGGLGGALGGAADANDRRRDVVRRCLAGRGYAVLD